ncbi:protoglobin domain-containing protein [Neobacillus drentensis]|uniref:globin domain-containing protein n=1 Tax=Neobacillus drentensis TaxID=220684 RepID=UPI002FFF546A
MKKKRELMMTIALEQEKVNELVEHFYDKLLKDSYYINMFTERNMDIELLKNRQRVFINRLVSEESAQEEGNQVSQVKERHPFQIAPERAAVWFGKLKETMEEMDLDVSFKEHLIEKVDFLLNKIIK